MRLATFVQISDLHFGDHPGNLDLPYLLSNINRGSLHTGALGHTNIALMQLKKFFLQANFPSYRGIIVTGDLTSVGHPNQFQNAIRYLSTSPIGLNQPQWKDWSIPGNHDQWPGFANTFATCPTGAPAAPLAKIFAPMPNLPRIVPLGNGWNVRFISIDSDHNVSPHGMTRRLGMGQFHQQLASVSQQLTRRKPPKEIRVMLIHHSYSYSQAHKLRIRRLSRLKLEEFVHDFAVDVMLTGHIHEPFVDALDIPHPAGLGGARRVLEARCPTTTQRDHCMARRNKSATLALTELTLSCICNLYAELQLFDGRNETTSS